MRYRDKLISINDTAVANLSHEEIIEIIKKSTYLVLETLPVNRWSVEVSKSKDGFGFGVRGGKNFEIPLYVLRVLTGSQAEKSCLINIGDVIEKINGKDIRKSLLCLI